MALTQRLDIRQSHALVMTPQLMQAIKLLQLSSLDLAAYVDNEVETNPLLESAGDDDQRTSERDAGAAENSDPTEWPDSSRADEARPAEHQASSELDDGAVGDADAGASRGNLEVPPGYSEWASV